MKQIQPFDNPVYVTSPLLPSFQALQDVLKNIWDSKWLTNHGKYHQELEAQLENYLGAPFVSIMNNGTLALMIALKALKLPYGSEVITTPFTFPATTHSITWNGLKPVFCDIEPETMTINVESLRSAITPNTSAVLAVHVYGFPCNVKIIDRIADEHGLKVIYDAAHAFSTQVYNKPISNFGDITMLSFHATKLFNTVEGGALVYTNPSLKDTIYYLRNFGIKNEEEVISVGINAKMNEIQAAIGLLNLGLVEQEKQKRSKIYEMYNSILSEIPGINIPRIPPYASNSYQYYPIKINASEFGMSRDSLYNKLKQHNIFTRKYFHPLCSDCQPYSDLPSAQKDNLPIASQVVKQVLCLPFYGDLGTKNANIIANTIKHICHYKR